MPGTTNGAELLRLLKETGTPDSKLAASRRLLAERYRSHREIAPASELVVALEAEFGPDHMTCEKARQLAATGAWVPAAVAVANEVPIEEQLLRGGPVRLPDPPPHVLPADPAAAPAVTAADLQAVLNRVGQLEQRLGDRTAENLALRAEADEASTRAAAAEAALAEAKAAGANAGDKPAGEPTTTSPPAAPKPHGGGGGRK